MAENKTKPTEQSVTEFIDAVPDPSRREDAATLCALIERVVGEPPQMWGPSIVGFGSYNYRYDSGHSGKASVVGFSPRAKELVLYLSRSAKIEELLGKLGKHKTGKSCVYVKRLADIDQGVLSELVAESYKTTKARYPN